MADAVITEYAGSRRDDTIVRQYQYGSGGVRVLDQKRTVRRVYRFDPSSDMMTEHDPAHPDRVLKRCIFDRQGMVEETFAPGSRPRTFRYENGGEQIAVREGGEFGQVGKLIAFEKNGVSETAWGRNGSIERVFVFERDGETITERAGGWLGEVSRTLLFSGIGTRLFFEPEAFLQFFIFSEWSDADLEAREREQVAAIRAMGSSRSAGVQKKPSVRARQGHDTADTGIDIIPDSDSPQAGKDAPPTRRSDSISFAERLDRDRDQPRSTGRSTEITVQERFERARQGREPLSRGRSVDIPLEERFGTVRREREEPLARGRSADIPLEERFSESRSAREKPKRGRSAEIPYSERRGED